MEEIGSLLTIGQAVIYKEGTYMPELNTQRQVAESTLKCIREVVNFILKAVITEPKNRIETKETQYCTCNDARSALPTKFNIRMMSTATR